MSTPTDDPADFEACADHEQAYPVGGSCPACDLGEARERVAIMDPDAALWTLALYAGEPDPGGWELGDGTAVDLDACVLALADALADRDDLDAECAECTAGAMDRDKMRKQFAALAERLRGALGDARKMAETLATALEVEAGCDPISLPWRADAPEGAAAFVGTWPGDESEAELLAAARVAGGTDAPEGEQP